MPLLLLIRHALTNATGRSLTGWTPGKHTIRIELVGPDGWPYRNGDYNVVTRDLTVIK